MTRRTALTTLAAASIPAAAAAPRVPVLVELFTSEGCSSCPPADLLLQVLDKQQPVPDADILVLSEHVDYWNYIGWNDPFSSPAFTRRQREYAQRFRIDGIYTPQMVVDGRTQFVGSDERAAARAIQDAASTAKSALSMSWQSGAFRITSSAALAADATVTIALAKEEAVSYVKRGENKGRELRHVGVVTQLLDAGTVKRGAAANLTVAAPELAGLRAIAFAQDRRTGYIVAACRGASRA